MSPTTSCFSMVECPKKCLCIFLRKENNQGFRRKAEHTLNRPYFLTLFFGGKKGSCPVVGLCSWAQSAQEFVNDQATLDGNGV